MTHSNHDSTYHTPLPIRFVDGGHGYTGKVDANHVYLSSDIDCMETLKAWARVLSHQGRNTDLPTLSRVSGTGRQIMVRLIENTRLDCQIKRLPGGDRDMVVIMEHALDTGSFAEPTSPSMYNFVFYGCKRLVSGNRAIQQYCSQARELLRDEVDEPTLQAIETEIASIPDGTSLSHSLRVADRISQLTPTSLRLAGQ